MFLLMLTLRCRVEHICRHVTTAEGRELHSHHVTPSAKKMKKEIQIAIQTRAIT